MASAVETPDHSLLDLPAPVKATIMREAIGRPIASLERGSEEGRTVYFVRVEQEGIDKRLTIAADGTVLKVSDYAAVNDALEATRDAGKGAWDKTKDVSGEAWDTTKKAAATTWQATKETVNKATNAFRSDELTLNQVPVPARAAMEREAAGDRLHDIHVSTEGGDAIYRATITRADGTKRPIRVREDGMLVANP
jgi:uncharacterized membrane protein YkoI